MLFSFDFHFIIIFYSITLIKKLDFGVIHFIGNLNLISYQSNYFSSLKPNPNQCNAVAISFDSKHKQNLIIFPFEPIWLNTLLINCPAAGQQDYYLSLLLVIRNKIKWNETKWKNENRLNVNQ